MRKLLMAVCVAPLFLVAGQESARAQDFFAVVTIGNQTQDTITYTLTWGGVGTRTVTLFPGQVEAHWFQNDFTTPPSITYDPNVNVPGFANETLQAYRSASNTQGKAYAFRQTPANNNVYLMPLN